MFLSLKSINKKFLKEDGILMGMFQDIILMTQKKKGETAIEFKLLWGGKNNGI